MPRRTPVGGLLLESFQGWNYEVQSNVILATREHDPGNACITHIINNQLDQPLTHERCLALLARMGKVSPDDAIDVQMHESVCGPYGAATFERGPDLLRAWYCNRPPGLIMGIYFCPKKMTSDSAYRFMSVQWAHIITTAIFDRPSWGGEDELTKVLVDGIERAEAERFN